MNLKLFLTQKTSPARPLGPIWVVFGPLVSFATPKERIKPPKHTQGDDLSTHVFFAAALQPYHLPRLSCGIAPIARRGYVQPYVCVCSGVWAVG
jgi:hypothetical protein